MYRSQSAMLATDVCRSQLTWWHDQPAVGLLDVGKPCMSGIKGWLLVFTDFCNLTISWWQCMGTSTTLEESTKTAQPMVHRMESLSKHMCMTMVACCKNMNWHHNNSSSCNRDCGTMQVRQSCLQTMMQLLTCISRWLQRPSAW